MRNRRETIDDFLSQQRIALVGLSHDPQHFSRAVAKELVDRGIEVIPVNPEPLEDEASYASVRDIPGPVGGALVMTPAAASHQVVEECVEAGIPRVWLHRGAGQGAVSDGAILAAEQAGLALVAGECPLMFLSDTHWFHRLHGGLRKLTGSYPA